MEERKERFSTFSSSNIYRLTGLGTREMTPEEILEHKKENSKSRKKTIKHRDTPNDQFYNYVKEKKREAKLKREINTKAYTRPIIWGIVCELYVFEKKLGLEYSNMNKVGRLIHGEIENWTGIPDTFQKTKKIVGDIKCPSSLIKFCDLIENHQQSVEIFKENHFDYYWQLVSNTILTGEDKSESIFFVPYLRDLEEIGDFVDNLPQEELPKDLEWFQIQFISEEIKSYLENGKMPMSIPYLPNDSEYKSFNSFVFDIPQEDIDFLTERVKKAVEELNK